MISLVAKNLAKTYGKRQVVKDVSLTVNAGEVVGLLGPNGAGKTTSFYMIIGLVPNDKGLITLNEVDLSHEPMHERARKGLGYLPQESSIFKKLTVSQNIMSVLEMRKDLDSNQKADKLDDLISEFHIEHIRDSQGMALSGGERRRVEIARALAADPKIILLDEPFAGVDPISVIDIKNIIKQLTAKGIGVLITDHNVRETLDVCEKAYIVSHGELIAEGSPEQVLANEVVKRVYLGEQFKL